ncbi:hypothetical protein EV424DRAFT_1555358 [Suillus variegatus]|nr:hypothetical protein EV424DRAFT_1555358 [Suillus variegatus]
MWKQNKRKAKRNRMRIHQEGLISCSPKLVCCVTMACLRGLAGSAPLDLEIDFEARNASISNAMPSLDLTSSSQFDAVYYHVKHQPYHIKPTQAGLSTAYTTTELDVGIKIIQINRRGWGVIAYRYDCSGQTIQLLFHQILMQGFLDLGFCENSKDEALQSKLSPFPSRNRRFARDVCARVWVPRAVED